MNEVTKYNSEADTLKHQKRIMQLVNIATAELLKKVALHDNSKLYEPEKEIFDEWTPKLKTSTIGTEEYENMKKQMKVALDHHYANNTHHPEHYENGIEGMDLLELFEMFFDWKAASERHLDGNIYKSITVNKERFKMSDQLEHIFINTAKRMNFQDMKEFYKELKERQTYLESLEQTDEVKGALHELLLITVRVQQILLSELK